MGYALHDTAAEGDAWRFEVAHKETVWFGFRKGDISTFSVYSDRRVACLAGNSVRWEVLNKKGEGNPHFT